MAIKKRKKIVSKTEKKLKNQIYYLRRKNKLLIADLSAWQKKNLSKMYTFEGRKRKGTTVLNIIRNKIKDNNSVYEKSFNSLNKRFKKDFKNKQKQVFEKSKGLYTSEPYEAWYQNQLIAYIENKAKNDINLIDYIIKINEVFLLMGNYDLAMLTYDKRDKKNIKFNVFIIENN